MSIIHTVEFLEHTAKAQPDHDISYGKAMVCYGSLAPFGKEFTYWERYKGGSLTRRNREEINALMQQAIIKE